MEDEMVEWKKLPRSIRLEKGDVQCDVWPFLSENGDRFSFTVMESTTGAYLAGGSAQTQDAACEAAMKEARI